MAENLKNKKEDGFIRARNIQRSGNRKCKGLAQGILTCIRTLKGLKAQAELAAFALSMRENASRWLLIVPDDIKSNKKDLYDAFLTRFTSSPQTYSEKMRQFWTARQEEKESVRNFIDRMQSIASDLSIRDPILTTAIQSGLKPSIKQHVARQNPQTVSALLEHALLAESTDFGTESSMTDVTAAIRRLEEKFDKVQIAAMSTDAPRDDHNRRTSSPRHHPYDRRLPFGTIAIVTRTVCVPAKYSVVSEKSANTRVVDGHHRHSVHPDTLHLHEISTGKGKIRNHKIL